MDEVGDPSREFHAEIFSCARERGVDRLLALGDATTALLVKGWRFMRMERVVERLADGAG